MRLLRVVFIAAIAFAVGSCSPEFRAPFDISHTDLHVQQTFGQLVTHNATRSPATSIKVKLPAGADVRTPTSGVVKYEPNFEGLGPSLLLNPTTYFSSDSDFKFIKDEGLPDESDIRIVLANLDETTVRDAAQSRYATVLNKANPTEEAANFIDRTDGNREIDVVASANLANSTRLGKAQGDVLFVAAYLQDDGRVTSWVNPLPYILAGLAAADQTGVDSEVPEITEVVLAAATNADMSSPSIYTVPSSNTVAPPNVLFNHVSVYARLQDRSKASTANITPYEFAYFFSKVIRDSGGSILTKTLVSQGRHLMNKIGAGGAIPIESVYEPARTDATVQDFWYQLPVDLRPIAGGLKKSNWSSGNTSRVLDVSGFDSGEYELLLRVRDAVMPGGLTPTYSERRIFVNVDSSPSAIQAAKWSLSAQNDTNTTIVDVAGEPGSLVLSGSSPWAINLQIAGAPAITAPGKMRYKIRGNGVDVDPTSDAALFPGGNDQIGAGGTAQSITVNNEGVHDVTVWIDSDDDQVVDDEEASRRLVVLNFSPVLAVTAESKHPTTAYAALTGGTTIGSADSLRLTLNVTGVPSPSVMAAAKYDWEIATINGPITTSGSNVWEVTDIPFTGEMQAKVTLDLFDAKFDATWSGTVIGAQFAEVRSLCETKTRSIGVELSPPALPIGDTVEVSIAASGAGAAQFSGGAVIQMLSTNGTVDVEATAVSTARNDLALVAKYDGIEIANEPFSVCGQARFVDSTVAPAGHLEIGKWTNAYNGTSLRNDNNTGNNFIDLDTDRFYLEVIDWDKNVDPTMREVVTGNLAVIADVLDSEDQIRLVETGVNSGLFRSYSHLLMAPDLPSGYHPDDDLETYDGFNDNAPDDTFGDRTHRSSVDSMVQFSYRPEPAGAPISDTIAVCRENALATCQYTANEGTKCTATLSVRNFLEPFRDSGFGKDNSQLDSFDCNGNGVIDPGESEPDPDGNGVVADADDQGICAANGRFDYVDSNGNNRHDSTETSEPFRNISGGNVSDWGTSGSRSGVMPEAKIRELISVAQVSYAQACISISAGGTILVEAPAALVGGGNVLDDGQISIASGASSAGNAGTDALAIDQAFPVVPASANVIDVFVVGPIQGAHGYGPNAQWNNLVGSARGNSTSTLIASDAEAFNNTLAHELGHLLTNRFDLQNATDVDRINFFPGTGGRDIRTSDRNVRRRLLPASITEARTQMTNASGAGPGNINLQ